MSFGLLFLGHYTATPSGVKDDYTPATGQLQLASTNLLNGVVEQQRHHSELLGITPLQIEHADDLPKVVVLRFLDVDERLIVEEPDARR